MPPVPNVSVKKSAVGASPAISSADGVLAIIASASAGPFNTPGPFATDSLLLAQYPLGPLPEYSVYDIDTSGRSVVAMRSNPSVPGTYTTVVHTGVLGTSVPSAGGTVPLEHYNVSVFIVNGGTVGTTGITYQYWLDGQSLSGVQALGTLTTLTIPNSGVSFSLAAGTLLAGDTWSCFTERSLMNNTDLATSLAALTLTRLPFEAVLIDCEYLAGTVGLIDTWLGAREPLGMFNWAAINTRFLLEPTPTAETVAAYSAALATLTSGDASNRMCVGADGGHAVSLVTGLNLKRPTALALCAMAMSVTPNIGIDVAWTGLGPVPSFNISSNSAPNDWDESIYGGLTGILDPMRFVTLRTFPPGPGAPQGTYITNPNVFIPSQSNITYLQYLRILNKACAICWQVLNGQLSIGINTVPDATGQNQVIEPASAHDIEALVNPVLAQGLSGQVQNQLFTLNRTDPLNTPGAPINGNCAIEGKFYVKDFNIVVALVKTISAPIGGV